MGRINRKGYWYILNHSHPFSGKQGYVAEHRLVMEKHLGRYLTPKETIHHINDDPSDNRLENLELCESNGQHTKIHHPEVYEKARQANLGRKPANYARTPHTCNQCGKEFLANPNRNKRFCSHSCYGKSKKGMNISEKQRKALKLGHGWNKGKPLTWQKKGKESPHYKHGKYSKYV